MKKANNQMMQLRTGEAASMLARGHNCTVTTAEMDEKYELSRRQARRIKAKAMDLIIQDFEEINIERPQMVAKLLVILNRGCKKDCSTTNQVALLPVQDK